mmetsp:Transcript_7399/g.11891  ORF Transcript_7399/g.11891 Transcript_7399/m.11891 type:complete len:141 (+) Transcript_7399:468-890(+)
MSFFPSLSQFVGLISLLLLGSANSQQLLNAMLQKTAEGIKGSCTFKEEKCYDYRPECFWQGVRNAISDSEIESTFDALDSNGSGDLDLVEVAHFAQAMGTPCEETEFGRSTPWAYTLLLRSDKDTSMTIDFEEFEATLIN